MGQLFDTKVVESGSIDHAIQQTTALSFRVFQKAKANYTLTIDSKVRLGDFPFQATLLAI